MEATMSVKRTIGSSVALVAACLVLGPRPVAAQAGPVMPWLGCWVEVGAPADAPMTCFVPEDGGAALLTVSRAGVTQRQAFHADGAAYPVETGGCTGTETVEPSSDMGRLFVRSELHCEGGTERVTGGLLAMVGSDEWIRVRTLTVQGIANAWTQRYRPAPASRIEAAGLTETINGLGDLSLAIESARMAASSPPSVDDVIEASAKTDQEAVRTWIAEQGEPLMLDRDALLRLADAGVSAGVIDVAVAVSYPDHFVVGQQDVERVRDRYDRDRDRYRDPYSYRWSGFGWWPFYYDPWYGYGSPYSRYGYGLYSGYYGYGYGYGYPGWGAWGGWGRRGVVYVRTVDEDDAFRHGRVVNGRGYSSGRSGVRPGSSSATRRTGTAVQAGRGSSRATVRSPSRPSRATRSPARTSSSSSSSSKGKAKPRGGGGGN
jgi:hypothetical protein